MNLNTIETAAAAKPVNHLERVRQNQSSPIVRQFQLFYKFFLMRTREKYENNWRAGLQNFTWAIYFHFTQTLKHNTH